MTYIDRINAFEGWLETNYLPAQSQLIYYKLLVVFNRCGWAEWVTVDNHRLMSLSQVTRESTFIENRNKLIQAGLIEYQKGKKGSPNRYRLLKCTFKYGVQSEVQTVVETEVKSVVNTEVQTEVINRERERIKKDTNVSKKKIWRIQ